MSRCNDLKNEFQCRKFGLGYDYPVHFIVSACGHRVLYPIWTTFWMLYHLAWISYHIYNEFEGDKNGDLIFFSKLTNWGYIILIISNVSDAISTLYVHFKRPDIFIRKDLERFTPWYLKLSWLLFEMSNTPGVLITMLYYGLLTPKDDPLSIEYHAINTVYIISNFFVCSKPVRILHVIYPSLFGIVYAIYSVIDQEAVTKEPYYSFLDWDNPGKAVLYCLALVFIAVPIIHLVFFGLYKLRTFIQDRCCMSRDYDLRGDSEEKRTSI